MCGFGGWFVRSWFFVGYWDLEGERRQRIEASLYTCPEEECLV